MDKKVINELDLSVGHACVYQLFGRDARDLMRCMSGGGDSTEGMEMLACRCVTIDGTPLDLPAMENLPFEDYLDLLKAVQGNFTRTAPKES